MNTPHQCAPAAPLTARIYRQAVVVGATNPKVLVLFAAILPQFTDPAAGAAGLQMAVLGTLFAQVRLERPPGSRSAPVRQGITLAPDDGARMVVTGRL